MPRCARKKVEYETYHVIQRGYEKKSIFYDDEDQKRYLEILQKNQEKYSERNRLVKELRCNSNLSLKEIGKLVELSESRVSRIIKSAEK